MTDLEANIINLTKRIKTDPQNLDLRVARTHALYLAGRDTEFRDELAFCSEHLSDCADVLGLQGLLAIKQGSGEEAFTLLSEALESREQLKFLDADLLLFYRGCLHKAAGRRDEAVWDLAWSFLLTRNNVVKAGCLCIRAGILRELGFLLDAAKVESLEAVRLYPEEAAEIQAYRCAQLRVPQGRERRRALEGRRMGIADRMLTGNDPVGALRLLDELEIEVGPQIELAPFRIDCLALLDKPLEPQLERSRRLAWTEGYIYTWAKLADWEWYQRLEQLAPKERAWSIWEDSFC